MNYSHNSSYHSLQSVQWLRHRLTTLLSPVHTVAAKWDCRRKVRLSPKTARQRRNSATVALFRDSLTFLRRQIVALFCDNVDRLLSPVHIVAEKWDSRRIRRQSPFFCDSRTFLRQCGQGFRRTCHQRHYGDRWESLTSYTPDRQQATMTSVSSSSSSSSSSSIDRKIAFNEITNVCTKHKNTAWKKTIKHQYENWLHRLRNDLYFVGWGVKLYSI